LPRRPANILKEKDQFNAPLRRYLTAYSFYYVDAFFFLSALCNEFDGRTKYCVCNTYTFYCIVFYVLYCMAYFASCRHGGWILDPRNILVYGRTYVCTKLLYKHRYEKTRDGKNLCFSVGIVKLTKQML